MNFYDDQDATAGMTNEQKSQAAKIMVLSMAKVWGEFRHINKMFRDSTPDFQILSIDHKDLMQVYLHYLNICLMFLF